MQLISGSLPILQTRIFTSWIGRQGKGEYEYG